MIIGLPNETMADEKRVALDPAAVGQLVKLGVKVRVERGAGVSAGFADAGYELAGAELVESRGEVFGADVVVQVRAAGANTDRGGEDIELMREGLVVVGHAEPLTAHNEVRAVAERGATLISMELVPRITRAQSMDALSSQANLAGYKAVIMAAGALPQMFPLMMTAAGTVQPAKVFVIGAGVAGLQAIATAKRLGAVVSAIDVRPEVKEQVESLGARFVAPPATAEGEGGYAKAQSEEQKARQQEMMAETIADSDVVITTANIPGRKAPVLVTAGQVASMRSGSVIVDLAAERGGNCEATVFDETVVTDNGVTVMGVANVPALVARDASRLYGRNVVSLLKHLMNEKSELVIDLTDEITAGTVVCHTGEVVHPAVRKSMGMEPLEAKAAEEVVEKEEAEAVLSESEKEQAGKRSREENSIELAGDEDEGGDESGTNSAEGSGG